MTDYDIYMKAKDMIPVEDPIIIIVEGGIVQEIYNLGFRNAVVLDYDKCGEEDIVVIPYRGLKQIECKPCGGIGILKDGKLCNDCHGAGYTIEYPEFYKQIDTTK